MMNLDAYPDAFKVYETLGECQMKAAGAEVCLLFIISDLKFLKLMS